MLPLLNVLELYHTFAKKIKPRQVGIPRIGTKLRRLTQR